MKSNFKINEFTFVLLCIKMIEKKLFELARPYLEKNDFGAEHTQRVLKFAKNYFSISKDMMDEVLALIILHDIGGSSTKEQYEKGPKIAEKLMKKIGYSDQIIDNVCEMIKRHHSRLEKPSDAFKILYDSDQLTKLSEEEFQYYNSKKIDWNRMINSMYFYNSKEIAKKLLKDRIINKN